MKKAFFLLKQEIFLLKYGIIKGKAISGRKNL